MLLTWEEDTWGMPFACCQLLLIGGIKGCDASDMTCMPGDDAGEGCSEISSLRWTVEVWGHARRRNDAWC